MSGLGPINNDVRGFIIAAIVFAVLSIGALASLVLTIWDAMP